MNTLTRRNFGIAALAAPAILTSTTTKVLADGHSKGAPAVFDCPVGNYRMTALFDGMAGLQKGFFLTDDVAAMDAALAAGGITGDAMPAPITAYLLQGADRTILIDSGIGDIDALGPGLGRVSDGLAALGVAPEDIDLIIVTHAHLDHVGGMIGANGPVFPNAEVAIMQAEIDFWGDDGIMAQAPDEAKGLFQIAQSMYGAYADQLKPVTSGADVAPGIKMELSPGHTPGHAHVHIDGGDSQLLMVADSLHSSVLHTALPDVGFGFDVDSALAATSRRTLFDRAATDNLLIAATHIPFPGVGRFVRSGDAYAYVPASVI